MNEAGVTWSHDALHLNGRSWPMREIRLAAAEHRNPSIRFPLALAVAAGAGVIPGMVMALGHTDGDTPLLWAGLAIASIVFFGSVIKLLFVDTRYLLVLETARGPVTAFESSEHEVVVSLVAQINDRIRARML